MKWRENKDTQAKNSQGLSGVFGWGPLEGGDGVSRRQRAPNVCLVLNQGPLVCEASQMTAIPQKPAEVGYSNQHSY